MNLAYTSDEEFIRRLTEMVEANLENENFGVNELVLQTGLSHHLVRKRIKTILKKNISQFISEFRLHRALGLLQQGTVTASEVAYQVGFGSPSYFTSCFHNFFGYPPGEVKRRVAEENDFSGVDMVNPGSANVVGENHLPVRKKTKLLRILIMASIVVIIGMIFFLTYRADLNSYREKSIAVLPFHNLNQDKENQYFADGVMKEILLNLSYIKDFKVISFTSTEQFRGTTKSIPEIAKMLRVNYILEGSIQRYGERVKVIVELIDAGKDQYIFSLPYDGNLTDIFNIQSDIARQVAGKLQATLSTKEMMQISKIPTRNMEAYKLYQMGRFFWSRRNKADQLESIKYFEKALTIDPGYASAYAGLADANFILVYNGWIPRQEGYEKSKKLALKALELDNNLAEAHATLGDVLCWGEWKWEEARKEHLIAIEKGPNYATGFQYYSELLDILGDRAEARKYINLALEMNPFSWAANIQNALCYFNEGKYPESLEAYRKAASIDPVRLTSSTWPTFKIFYLLGDKINAAESLKFHFVKDSLLAKYADQVNGVLGRAGLDGLVIFYIEKELIKEKVSSFRMAQSYAMLDRKDEALKWLEIAFEQRSATIIRINSDLTFKNLHSEPRFKELIKKMGLSDYFKE